VRKNSITKLLFSVVLLVVVAAGASSCAKTPAGNSQIGYISIPSDSNWPHPGVWGPVRVELQHRLVVGTCLVSLTYNYRGKQVEELATWPTRLDRPEVCPSLSRCGAEETIFVTGVTTSWRGLNTVYGPKWVVTGTRKK
jgi:hypothetical protein